MWKSIVKGACAEAARSGAQKSVTIQHKPSIKALATKDFELEKFSLAAVSPAVVLDDKPTAPTALCIGEVFEHKGKSWYAHVKPFLYFPASGLVF